jgi:cyanophycinase
MKTFLFFMTSLLVSVPVLAQKPCLEAINCKRQLLVAQNHLVYYSNYEISKINKRITKAVIVVHGTLRDGDNYFNNMVKVATNNQKINETLIISPHFKRSDDEKDDKEVFWGRRWYQKWKYGYKSQDIDQISSFELIDILIKKLKAHGIKSVVITGHSAGGQFTQRYAISTQIDKEIDITFAPSNPSSYMFLHDNRYQFINSNYKAVNPIDCKEFNEYIYGPINRAEYLQKLTVKELQENYAKKDVVYLMGENDHDTDYLDESCEANLQGKDRFDRAQNFNYYVNKHFKNNNHSFVSVPAVGHDSYKIYNSLEGQSVLFDIKKQMSSNILYKKIGNDKNKETTQTSLSVLLGGGKNETNGFRHFLNAAGGGDIVVLTGKGYLNNRYTHDIWKMAEEFKIKIDSVESIALLNKNASNEEFVLEKIRNAEAIFFTGGDQSKYIDRIKNSELQTLLQKKINTGVAIAGTSAGLAIMGEYIFSAVRGGITSLRALKNPLSKIISIESNFLNIPGTENIITDTHFSNRNREGRLLSFMYRTQRDYNLKSIVGLGIDEQTSLTIFSNGDTMAQGLGNVIAYKSNKSISTNTRKGLNYKNIVRTVLEKDKTLNSIKSYELLKSDMISVTNGNL